MVKCNSCGTQQEICYIDYAESVKRKRNWEKEFLAQKGVVKDNDFQLCSPCQTEIKEFKAAEVVKELNQNNLVDTECFPLSSPSTPNYLKASNFTAEGAKKVQRAITENIKRHSKEWKIVRAKLLNSDREYYHDWNGDYKNNELKILLHQSAKLEYGEDQFLKREENKMYLEEYFLPEQWAEIEEKINAETQPDQSSNDKQEEKTIKFFIIGGICLVSGIIILFLFYLVRKKTKTIKTKN